MPSKLRNTDGTFINASSFASEVESKESATITTTGAISVYFTAPVTGVLSAVDLAALVALVANDTNYITFTVTNLGQSGAGTTVMLAATNPNTTKATGGVGLAINTRRALTVHGTTANLAVVKGDRIRVTATATGTLANTVTVPIYSLTFSRTV